MKRIFDIIVSILCLVVFSPAFLTAALIIKLGDGGSVFYRGTRIGKDGKPFRIFKFRTMVVDAEKIGGPSTADDDPRITRIGKFLRKTKLDELPQIINVLTGEMSIVGPRPEVPVYVDMFSEEEKAILSVRPGITDYASIWNPDEGAALKGSDDPERVYKEKIRPKKIELQLRYIKERSFLTDIKIIMQTFKAVVGRRKPALLGEEKNDS